MVKKAATEVNITADCFQSVNILSQNCLSQEPHHLWEGTFFGYNFLFCLNHFNNAARKRNTFFFFLHFLRSLSCLCSRTCPWSSFLFTNPTSTTCSSLWSCSVTTSKLRTSLLETISASRSSGKISQKPHRRSPGAWLGSLCIKREPLLAQHNIKEKINQSSSSPKNRFFYFKMQPTQNKVVIYISVHLWKTTWWVWLYLTALSSENLVDSSYVGKWRRRLMGGKTFCTDHCYMQ